MSDNINFVLSKSYVDFHMPKDFAANIRGTTQFCRRHLQLMRDKPLPKEKLKVLYEIIAFILESVSG